VSGNRLTRYKSNLNKGLVIMVIMKWSILNTIRRVIVLHDKTYKLSVVRISCRRSRVKCLTHTLLKAVLRERILHSQGKTERSNGPKSVVGPFDEIRRIGKASGIES
jgi:hypothetical protein